MHNTIVTVQSARQSIKPPPIKPKNGRYFVCLLAGGAADIARELKEKVAGRAPVLFKYHWDYEKRRAFQGSVPEDVDFILLLKDFIGHANGDLVKKAAARSGTRLITSPSQWARMYHSFWRYGITGRDAQPVPLNVVSSAVLHELGDTPAPIQVEPPPAVTPEPAHEAAPEAPRNILRRIRAETLALVAQLQEAILADGIEAVMISGAEFTVQRSKA